MPSLGNLLTSLFSETKRKLLWVLKICTEIFGSIYVCLVRSPSVNANE